MNESVQEPLKRLTMEKFVASPLLISVSIIRGIFFMILLVHFMSLPRRVSICNPHIPNIDAISGALFTLTTQYEYSQTQCDEGARDGIDIWHMAHIIWGLVEFWLIRQILFLLWVKVRISFSWCTKRWNNQKSRFIVAFGLPFSALINFYKLYIYTCKYFCQCYISVLKV